MALEMVLEMVPDNGRINQRASEKELEDIIVRYPSNNCTHLLPMTVTSKQRILPSLNSNPPLCGFQLPNQRWDEPHR